MTPIANAKLDIWHANPLGQYSPGGRDYNCRAVIFTDAKGYYSFVSLMPGRYDDGGYRPAHIHFKVAANLANKYRNITTQLYFVLDSYLYPNDSFGPCNSGEPSLLVKLQHLTDIKTFVGKWNIALRKKTTMEDGADVMVDEIVRNNDVEKKEFKGNNYVVKKDHIIAKKMIPEDEVERLLEEKEREIESMKRRLSY